jgi:cytoskeletal protein CcmA (bactofilin family)
MTQEPVNGGRAAIGAGRAPDLDASKAEQREAPSKVSVMGADILVTGNIEALVDLNIEGRIIGDVRCATLILGPASSVTGSITADRVRVSGKVDGAIETTDLAIEAGAHVKGDVKYSRIRIASGAVLEGQLTHRPAPEEPEGEVKLKLVEAPGPVEAKHLYFE